MATPTYDLLESVTLATAASSVTFSSIDQSYGDLILVAEGELNPSANADFGLIFNSSTSGYSMVDMMGNGSATESQSEGNTYADCGTYLYANTGARQIVTVNIMDYAATDKHKSFLARNSSSGTSGRVWAVAGRWANTAAITTVKVEPSSGSLANGMTFNLYGVAK